MARSLFRVSLGSLAVVAGLLGPGRAWGQGPVAARPMRPQAPGGRRVPPAVWEFGPHPFRNGPHGGWIVPGYGGRAVADPRLFWYGGPARFGGWYGPGARLRGLVRCGGLVVSHTGMNCR